MIDERLIDLLVERLVDRIEEGNSYTLRKIGESIKEIGALSPSKAQQLSQILKYGGNYDKIVEKLAQITELNVKDIYEIFEEVAKSDYAFAKQFYDYRGVKYIPYEENIALQQQVKALARITAGEYANFSNTLAFTKRVNGRVVYTNLARTYQDTIDKAVLSIAQGKSSFQEQMYSTIKELGSSGIKRVDYASGRSVRLDSSVRQHLKGALRNLHNETQAVFGEEFGSDGVEISVHLNPAPDHAEVQGRQFSKEEFDKFQNDQDAVDYTGKLFTSEHDGHDRRSISEYNCYHYTFDIVSSASIISLTSCLSWIICISRSWMTLLCFSICSSCSRHNCSRLILFARDLFVFFRSDQLPYYIMDSLFAPVSVVIVVFYHLIFFAMHNSLLTDLRPSWRPRIQDQPASG